MQRVPEHRRLLDLLDRDVGELQVGVRVLQRVEAVLHRDLPADVLGRAGLLDVRADPRREGAARADAAAATAGEAPLRVAFGLLLPRDREHPLVDARLDEVRGDDDRGTTDRARGVHAQHRLARAAQRVGEEQLGLHDALERVGRLADDDGVDVRPRAFGVVERARRRFAQQAGHGDVGAPLLVVGLTDADDGALLRHDYWLPLLRCAALVRTAMTTRLP